MSGISLPSSSGLFTRCQQRWASEVLEFLHQHNSWRNTLPTAEAALLPASETKSNGFWVSGTRSVCENETTMAGANILLAVGQCSICSEHWAPENHGKVLQRWLDCCASTSARAAHCSQLGQLTCQQQRQGPICHEGWAPEEVVNIHWSCLDKLFSEGRSCTSIVVRTQHQMRTKKCARDSWLVAPGASAQVQGTMHCWGGSPASNRGKL